MNSDKINRRKALEKTSLLLGGVLTTSIWTGVLHGCGAPKELDWSPKFMTNEEAMLTEMLVDVLIPRTETPGASDAMAHRFIDEMLHGYFDPSEQKTVRNGLKELQETGFSDLSHAERIEVLQDLSDKAGQESETSFFQIMRSMTLLGYFTSEAGATQALTHDPVPGTYEGCIPIQKYGGKCWSES
ncbi:gluconate 2-dehydrogenase subunit 3 family protein [Maribacter algicola]|uniref:Gluconate 2-dehydrogenase subunit 3 family protein n=1 Tax=Meishania litoralis TaxID=3434685 RepID=A0ACC7LK04_9FLAO